MSSISEAYLIKYSESLSSIIDSLSTTFTLSDLTNEPRFNDDKLTELVNSNFIDLVFDDIPFTSKSVFFNDIVTTKIVDVLTEYQSSQDVDALLLKSFLILDVSIHLAFVKYICRDTEPFPMQTLNTIMLTSPFEFIVDTFGDVFFNSASYSRRIKLTLNNNLIARTRPGSTLLQIGTSILPKLINNLSKHDIFATKLRIFISSSLDINEKLLASSDWKVNSFSNTYLEFSKTKKWPKLKNTTSQNSRVIRGSLDNVYHEYLSLLLSFTSNFAKLIEEMNASKRHKFSRNSAKPVPFLDQVNNVTRVITEMDEPSLPQHRSNSKKVEKVTEQQMGLIVNEYESMTYDCDWILNEDDFLTQIQQTKNRRIIIMQLYIMLSFIHDFTEEKWTKLVDGVNAKLRKYKTPEFNCPKLENDHIKDKIAESLTFIERHYTKKDPEFARLMKYIVNYTEADWRFFKLKQFGHGDIKELIELSNFKKRKLEEHMENCKSYKKLHFHKYGTPKLSKAWTVKTGLEEIKDKLGDPVDKLDSYRDGLYFLNGNIDGKKQELEILKESMKKEREIKEKDAEGGKEAVVVDPEQVKQIEMITAELHGLNEDKDLLNWKALRLARGLGHWMKFNQVNERVGLDGLFDEGLIIKDEEERSRSKGDVSAGAATTAKVQESENTTTPT